MAKNIQNSTCQMMTQLPLLILTSLLLLHFIFCSPSLPCSSPSLPSPSCPSQSLSLLQSQHDYSNQKSSRLSSVLNQVKDDSKADSKAHSNADSYTDSCTDSYTERKRRRVQDKWMMVRGGGQDDENERKFEEYVNKLEESKRYNCE